MERYSRQILLSEIGTQGQASLSASSVVIVGCGGLGSIVAPYLAGAGVGTIHLIDGDETDISNVHRQVFYTGHEDQAKAVVLAQRLQDLNPEITVSYYTHYLQKENIKEQLEGADVVIECSDDIWCKYLVNDYCHIHSIPLVYGAIHKFEGHASFFLNKNADSIHLRDVFPEPDDSIPTCAQVGVLNTIAGIIGLFQANEVLKFILGIGTSLEGRWLSYDALSNRQLILRLKKQYRKDLQEIYQKEDFKAQPCYAELDISMEDWLANKEDYTLVSILEDDEHENIDSAVLRNPMSCFDKEVLSSLKKPILFYCASGKRSSALVTQLQEENITEVYSLAGGIQAYKKIKA